VDQAGDSAQAAAVTSAVSPRSTPAQHWLARLSFVLVGLAVVFVAVFAELKGLTMLAVGLAGAAVSLAAAFFFLSRRGVWRWLSLAVFALTPIAVIVVFALRNLLWVAVVAALVAGVAAQHGIPFVVISAGTRNHFALDLGLNRDDPSACLGALSDGVELRVDLGKINGQVFVNNASFGAYAEVVETPAYRGDKLNTTLNMLPDLLQGQRGARFSARADDTEIRSPQALLVANNPYGTGDIAGLSRRARLDTGLLGVIGVKVRNVQQAIDLLRGRRAVGLRVLSTKKIEITADAPQIPVGVDGEALSISTPVVCAISPAALRVWVPRDRPGVVPPKPPINWVRLWHLAGLHRERAREAE
jgi:diacylglycerol kinase family enzyme